MTPRTWPFWPVVSSRTASESSEGAGRDLGASLEASRCSGSAQRSGEEAE